MLSDDLEVKAISARYGVPEATVGAIAAGCDAVLMCGTSPEPQFARARGGDSRRRGWDAAAQAGRGCAGAAPPREGTVPRAARPKPLGGSALRAALGGDEHQAIAAEMARFA